MSTENRKKRKYSDSDGQAEPLRRSAVWFKDGNLIVQAQNTLFRVYRGWLAFYAPRIVELLDDPQRVVEIVDGAEVLVMQDAAEDVEVVFEQLFRRTFADGSIPSFTAVAACARIGKKYGIQSLYDDAVSRLSSVFPSTVERWLHGSKPRIASEPATNLRESIALQTLVLARELDLAELLPALFFWLSLDSSLPLIVDAHVAGVSREDILAVLDGVRRRRTAHKEIITKWLGSPAQAGARERCRTRDCLQQRPQLVLEIVADSSKDRDADAGASQWKWDTTWEKSFCAACITANKAAYEMAGKEMWAALPGMFGLGSWNEILGLPSQPPSRASCSGKILMLSRWCLFPGVLRPATPSVEDHRSLRR
ncbi:F-box domain-containing protein [Mycena chlorophos]|uniref:F-box domain-containing protein n=1 Tax=Mycena chlorophos TaxID=658473 RepID=A0A8H6S3V5_MYCCL|nr:F-box domain-containing protein [Mycena chlorophos]